MSPSPFVIEELDGNLKFSIAGVPDMFKEGDTFMMDWGEAMEPTEMRVVRATFEESRVVTSTYDVYPGMWQVEAVVVGPAS